MHASNRTSRFHIQVWAFRRLLWHFRCIFRISLSLVGTMTVHGYTDGCPASWRCLLSQRARLLLNIALIADLRCSNRLDRPSRRRSLLASKNNLLLWKKVVQQPSTPMMSWCLDDFPRNVTPFILFPLIFFGNSIRTSMTVPIQPSHT